MQDTDAFARSLASSFTGAAEEFEHAIADLRSIATVARFRAEQHCDAGAPPATGWIEAGMIRKYVIYANGQRRILDLLMPGDFFGLFDEPGLDISLQAVPDGTLIARCSRIRLLALMRSNSLVGQLVHQRSNQAIVRLERHLLVQGRTRAPEKVGAYLLVLAKRLGSPAADIDLPITRYDIADHLGIAVETVCRAITDLRQAGAIKAHSSRKISILDVQKFHRVR